MTRPRVRFAGALGLAVGASFGLPAQALAGVDTYQATVSIRLIGQGPVQIGAFSGGVSFLPGGDLAFGEAGLSEATAAAFLLENPLLDALVVGPVQVPGGRLGPARAPGGGFGGNLPISGDLGAGLVDSIGLPDQELLLHLGGRQVDRLATPSPRTNTASPHVTLSASFAPWNTGAVQYTSTANGEPGDPVTTRGSIAPTSKGGREIHLVSPVHVLSIGSAGSGLEMSTLAGVAHMTLQVPEPGILALHAAAVACLTVVGVRRRRSRVSGDHD